MSTPGTKRKKINQSGFRSTKSNGTGSRNANNRRRQKGRKKLSWSS